MSASALGKPISPRPSTIDRSELAQRMGPMLILVSLSVALSGCWSDDVKPRMVEAETSPHAEPSAADVAAGAKDSLPSLHGPSAVEACLVALREELHAVKPTLRGYLSMGYKDGAWIDFPDDVAKRVALPDVELLPASQATIPCPGTQQQRAGDREAGAEAVDAQEADPPRVFHAAVIRWLDERSAEVEYGSYASAARNQVGRMVVEQRDGAWKIKRYIGGGSF